MEKGDNFIVYLQNGKVFRGVVNDITSKVSLDIKNRAKVEKVYITATTGEIFSQNVCYKVVDTISVSFWIKLKSLIK